MATVDENGYYFKFEEIAKELYRVMKPGGVIAWIVGDKTKNGSETGTSFRQALYFKDIGFNLHDTMIYEKNNPTPQKSNRYQPCFEYMFILSKGKPKTFNPIMIEKKYIESRPNKMYNKDKSGMQIQHQYSSSSNLKIKNNIWKYNVGLLSLDGQTEYGHCKDKISILTVDEYRKYRKFLPNMDKWWFLLTPWSTPVNGYSTTMTVVSPTGGIISYGYYGEFGVRPVCIFSSSIFELGNDD